MDIERELDELYALPLEEFTRARNELASRLRKEGEREAADAVKAAKKPTQPAWVVNQLARTERKLVERLIEATEAIAGASGDEARDVLADQRDALGKLGQAARKLSSSAADRAVETLRAAAIDPEARATLRAGRLTREVDASGFPDVAVPSGRARAGHADELADRRRRREDEQRRLRELRDQARALERAAAAAERAAERAADEADRLVAEAEEARAAADAAAGDLERAEAEARRASSGRTRRR